MGIAPSCCPSPNRGSKAYSRGQWRVYRPGHAANFALYVGAGLVVDLAKRGRWRIPARGQLFRAPTLHLHAGWNFVSVPYPETGMTCHAARLELAALGSALRQITVGPSPTRGVIMKPKHGSWGNDLTKRLPYQKGFWIKVSRSVTATPSPRGYRHLGRRTIR